MAVSSGFFNAIKGSDGTYDRTYNAEQMSDMFEGLLSDGVYESLGDAMIVKATAGMTVQVGTGRIVLGNKWVKNDARLNITLAAAHAAFNRWSAIVVRIDYQNRTAKIVEKAGTASTSPTKPTIEDSTSIKEKCLAYIYVQAGVTEITQDNITDTRADTTICGWVTGLIKQVDTSELFLQWQKAYENFYEEMESWKTDTKNSYDAWFAQLSGNLQVNTYVEKYHKVVEIGSANGVFPLDMANYTYASTDIFFVNVNGIALTETYDYLLDTSKTPIEIHTNAELSADNILEITVLKSIIGQP